MADSTFRLALYMHERKRPKFNDFVEHCRTKHWIVEDATLLEPLDTLQPDVVLHKITDDLSSGGTDADAMQRVKTLDEFAAAHPEELELCLRILMDRSLTYAALSKLKLPAEHAACFACPSFVNATTDEDDVTKSISDAKMQGPYLVKTFRVAKMPYFALTLGQACGSAESHRMAIVFSPKDVATCGVPRPFCCQRYVNHQAVLWKIYVLDSMIRIVPRASTPDVVTEQDAHDFDSQALSKATIAPSPDVSAPSMEFVRAVAEAITAQMGISLFGFDLIHEKATGTWFIVDVNYFPTYEGVDQLNEQLFEYLQRRAQGSAKRQRKE